jgi:hypothetical protein
MILSTRNSLSYFGDELAGPLLRDRSAVAQGIASRDAHRALDQHVHAGSDVSRHEQRLAGGVVPNFPETAKPIDFLRCKLWKHLLAAGIDRGHVEPRYCVLSRRLI